MSERVRFTTGPWSHDHGEGTKVRDKDGGAIASISFTGHGGRFGGKRPVPEPIANAHLIAAAPDLYDALAGLIGMSEKFEGALFSERINAAKAALAKARGETV